ncbi:extracellular solute-binding protein [Clostridium sp. cel8]|jgi:ABC-type glycerol-3-phosphate transport system substrate-binding protein|uniref:ABC transporter substrate-binding protein n=1 Tax=Clostridium sp. cel8 TaxID=2663123 RepID=UPI0015F64D1A|nr:extracellular solute-binding protein [Clostridium sp. cel8]MBA5851446.1 extracellular solute-binding protein [Clostridium sp. cel8]
MKRYIKLCVIFIMILNLSLGVSCQKKDEIEKSKVYIGTINVITDERHKNQFETAAEEFKKIHNQANINVKVSNDIRENIDSLLKNKKSESDILTVNDEDLDYVLDNYKSDILNLKSRVSSYKGSILSNKIYNATVNGNIYAMPWDVLPELIVYRRDIFKTNDVNPDDIKTWQDYIEIGNKLKEKTGMNFMVNCKSDSNLNMILANQLGTSYFNSDKELDFKSGKWTKIFDLEKELYNNNLIVNVDSDDKLLSMAKDGDILTFIATPYLAYDLMNTMKSDDIWGVMKLPAFEPGGNESVSVGGTNLVINKNSDNVDLSSEFIKFILTDDKLQIDLLNNYGRIPVYKNAYYFKDINRFVNYYNNNIWKLFIDSQMQSFNIKYTKYFPEVKDKINAILSPDNLKSKDKKDLVSDITKAIEKVVVQ